MKLIYENVQKYFKENNCELLESSCKTVRQQIKYKCNICSRISTTTFDNFKRGKRCRDCGRVRAATKRKHSFEFVRKTFEDRGCELLSNEYNNNTDKLKYRCIKNHICETTFSDFYNGGYGCKLCGYESQSKLKAHKYTFIKEQFEKENFILESTEYINGQTKLNSLCERGHKVEITWNDFQQGRGCRQCWIDINRGENHQNWVKDRSRKSRTHYLLFDKRHIKILEHDINYKNYILDRENYTVDHIFPRIAFIDNNFDQLYGPKVIKEICNSPENLRIISRKENSKKSGKYNKEEFEKWIKNQLQHKGLY